MRTISRSKVILVVMTSWPDATPGNPAIMPK
jgi:hypothetical protein